MKPNIVFLDAYSLGKADLSAIRALGNYTEYEYTRRDQIIERFAQDRAGVTFDFSWQMSMTYSPQLPYYDGTPETGVVG